MRADVLAAAARQSLWLLAWQTAWVVALAIVLAVVVSERAGWSALAGGGIGLVWTVYMALALFRHSATHGTRLSPISFIVGWVIKVVLTLALLVIALRSEAVMPPALLGGLFGAMLAYWAWAAFRVNRAGEADGK